MSRRAIVSVLAICACSAAAWALIPAGWIGAKQADKAIRTVKAIRGPLEVTAAATGTFQALDYVDVGAQLSGQLKTIAVALGDTVRRGQVIAEIDDATAKARLAQAEASLASVRAQMASKHAQMELARIQSERNRLLVNRGFLSVSTQETTDASAASLAAEVDSLRAQAVNLAAVVGQARTELRFARVDAPMDGIVVALVARPGQTLNANQQAPVILRIANIESLALIAQASEADVVNIQPGAQVRFALLGLADREFSGHVRQILPSPNLVNGVVFYDVVVEVPRGVDAFRIGMTAQLFFVLEHHACMLKIPRVALPADFRPPRTVTLTAVSAAGEVRQVEASIEAVNDTQAGMPCAAAERAGLGDGANIVVTRNSVPAQARQ